MDLNPKNILIFAVLLGGAAHVMLFQNGYWNNFMLVSASLCVVVPVSIYKILNNPKRKKTKRRKAYADI